MRVPPSLSRWFAMGEQSCYSISQQLTAMVVTWWRILGAAFSYDTMVFPMVVLKWQGDTVVITRLACGGWGDFGNGSGRRNGSAAESLVTALAPCCVMHWETLQNSFSREAIPTFQKLCICSSLHCSPHHHKSSHTCWIYTTLLANNTWSLVTLPPHRQDIVCNWVFKIWESEDSIKQVQRTFSC